MAIYIQFVSPSQLISPVNGYTCRRITRQNIKQFGFDTIEELLHHYPDFPLMCTEYISKKSISLSRASRKQNTILRENKRIKNIVLENEYNKNPNVCSRCNTHISFSKRNNMFCSRSCANSRGPRTEDFKSKVSKKLNGRKHNIETKRKSLLLRGLIPSEDKPNTICVICSNDTKTKTRKTCSDKCYSSLVKRNSQSHPKCGGQKHTHRSKIYNKSGNEYSSESSYEVKVSEILNSLDVDWVRPSFVWYTDEKGNRRRYYPDFYLQKYDLYLDPKNDFLIKTDTDKIYRASKENGLTIVILGKNSINKKSINKMVEDRGNAPLSYGCKPHVLLLN